MWAGRARGKIVHMLHASDDGLLDAAPAHPDPSSRAMSSSRPIGVRPGPCPTSLTLWAGEAVVDALSQVRSGRRRR